MKRKKLWGKIFLVFLSLFSVIFVKAAQLDIAAFINSKKADMWNCSAEDFMKATDSKAIFVWNSDQKKSLHYAAFKMKEPLYFSGILITEADFEFADQKLDCMNLNIYNKGGITNRTQAYKKKNFVKFIRKLQNTLNKFCKKRFVYKKKLINRAPCYTCSWKTPYAFFVLKWSYSGHSHRSFRAQYITLNIYKDDSERKVRIKGRAELDLPSRVKKNDKGDRYIEVPMVDQGPRGYCVVACAERILKYYGLDVDQHTLAQAAGTSSRGGTSVKTIEKSMKSIGSKCRFHVKEVSDFETLVTVPELKSFVNKYNQCARKVGKEQLNLNDFRTYEGLFSAMDEATLVKTKIRFNRSDFRKFKKRVIENIDKGLPVLWCVMLGIIKEPKLPQRMGGHMRLIIGYNPKTDEIIYSDSWGQKHGYKRITWGKAWAMTQMAHILIPKKKR